MSEGDKIIILDNTGMQHLVVLGQMTQKEVQGEIISSDQCENEPKIKLHLYISLTQREKFEFILQKCTEIGVAAFHPFISSRSLVRNPKIGVEKISRWQNIIKEAAEQSGRAIIPEIDDVKDLIELVENLGNEFQEKFIAWEELSEDSIWQPAGESSGEIIKIALFIGPEGGFEREEIDLAIRNGIDAISLGKRTLRTETAAIAGSFLIIYAYEINSRKV